MSDKIGNWARKKWSFMRQIKKMVRGGLKKILTQIYSMEFMQSSRRRARGEAKLRPLLLFEDTKGNFSASASPAACSQLCGARSFQRFHQRREIFSRRAFIRWNTLCFDVIKLYQRPWLRLKAPLVRLFLFEFRLKINSGTVSLYPT